MNVNDECCITHYNWSQNACIIFIEQQEHVVANKQLCKITGTLLLIRITKVLDINTVTLCYGVVQPRRTDRLHPDQVSDTF